MQGVVMEPNDMWLRPVEIADSLPPESAGSWSPERRRRECAGEAGRSQRNRPPAGFGLAAEIGGNECAASTDRNTSTVRSRQLCRAVSSVVEFETRTDGVADRTEAASPACNVESIKREAL